MSIPDEVFVSFDVEADGPYAPEYSMLSIGLSVAGTMDSGVFHPTNPAQQTLYLEIAPISHNVCHDAMRVNKLDRARIIREGHAPANAMDRIEAWLVEIRAHRSLVLVAYPSTFDWPFLAYYFHKFGRSGPPVPFTRVCDLRTYIVAKSRSGFYTPTPDCLPTELLPERAYSHHALNDAIEQARLFNSVHAWTP